MTGVTGAELFERLSEDEKSRYINANRQMTGFALAHAVPIIIAPPLRAAGEVKGGTGSLLRLGECTFALTASHVLEHYERRMEYLEGVYWQLGKLPPFDPRLRTVWRDKRKDIVLLRLEDNEIEAVGPCLISTPAQWPPPVLQEGEIVLLAGFPGAQREVDPNGRIGAGTFSTLFRVATVGEDYCTCRIEHKDLVSFNDEAVPLPGTDLGGISGGPVFLVRDTNYPLVGIIVEHGYMDFASLDLIRIATLASVIVK